MSFFDKLLKGLGFDNADEEDFLCDNVLTEKTITKENLLKDNAVNAQQNLNVLKEEICNENKIDNENLNKQKIELKSDFFAMPKNQGEILGIVNSLKKGQSVTIDFSYMDNTNFIRSMDFLCGVIYATNGEIFETDKCVYYLKINKGW